MQPAEHPKPDRTPQSFGGAGSGSTTFRCTRTSPPRCQACQVRGVGRRDAYLLPEANSGTCIEWEEDEGIWRKVFVKSLVQETIRIELQGLQ